MNQKEINELRRRFRPEKSAISRVYGCYVNSSKEIVSDLDESLGMMPQEESEKYLSLLKKGLSGSLGKNLIDIVFSTQQVVDSEEHRLLTTLRDSQLKDNEARQTFYHKVIDSLDMGDSSYLLLLTCDSYDVPHRGKDDSLQADASDEVFTYIVCVVCPIKEGKVELGYFPGDNEFHCAAGQTVAPPELGFLFPAFDDRAANIYNALFYSRKANEIHQEFIDAIFHVEAPMSAVEQKEAFQSALSDAFDCSLEVMQTVHEQLREKIKEHRESRSSEPLEMSASEIGQILQSCGIADEQVAAFQENCGEQFGSGVVLNPANLIDSSRFEIKTPEITISADPEYSYLVETQIINGRKYLLGVHGPQILQESSLTQVVHKSLQHLFELRGVEPILVMGPPGVPELLLTMAEIHAEVAYSTQCLVQLFFGIEQPHLIQGGGAQYKLTIILGVGQIMLLAKLLQRHFFSQQIKCAVDPARSSTFML